jgi:hypothetical protein
MPGYQFTSEAIHADWPIYPAGHGPDCALETLCCFPRGTHFRAIDDIDRCLLLIAVEQIHRRHAAEEYSERHHHVALWHKDLRLLRDEGWLDGFKPHPTAEELQQYWVTVAESMPTGVRAAAVDHAKAFDWEGASRDAAEQDEVSSAMIVKEGLSVTPAGWKALDESAARTLDIHQYFADRVQPLLTIGFYDSAVREAAILLESDLRARTGTDLFTQELVRYYIEKVVSEAGMMGAFQRHLRSELRTVFSFVRNEFAHNIVTLDPGRCYALLRRISAIYAMLDVADRGGTAFQDIMLALKK